MVWVLVALFLPSGGPQASVVVDRVLAVVNGEVITLSDVRAVHDLRLPVGGRTPPESEDLLVRLIVERRLVLEELRRFQVPEPDRATVTARVEAWQRQLGQAEASARAEQTGVDAVFIERWLADELRREAYVEQRFASLPADRRADAVQAWIEGLRQRATIVHRVQRF